MIVGPQASGKGTQAEKLVEKYHLAYVQMGDILRKLMAGESVLAVQVKDFVNKGILVPDEIIIKVINEYLGRVGELEGVLFDGFPRTLSQAQYFEEFLKEKGKQIDLIVYITLPREVTLERLSNRRTCEKCAATYNLVTKPPKNKGFCDNCGGRLIIRGDETPQAINTRLDYFEKNTKPMIDFYRQKEMVEEIDGNRPIEIIFEDIVEKLKKRGLVNA